ncbi:MAG: TspO/MBR family protein [Candidatus Gracilibacteria bacterium]
MKKFLLCLAAIVLCESAGLLGSFFTFPAIDSWYATLEKPSFSPPNWLFGPAWTLLYALMGIALFLLWQKGWAKTKKAQILFYIQLALNLIWSPLFFGLKRPDIAFFELVLLWVFILWTAFEMKKIKSAGAYLFLPYIAWVSFAGALNAAIWWLN